MIDDLEQDVKDAYKLISDLHMEVKQLKIETSALNTENDQLKNANQQLVNKVKQVMKYMYNPSPMTQSKMEQLGYTNEISSTDHNILLLI